MKKKIDLWTETEFIKVGNKFLNKNSNGKMYTEKEYKELLKRNQKELQEAQEKIKEAEEIIDGVKQKTMESNRTNKKSKRK